jgi:acetylornithine/LysW-gamma-L-lysine aminotransferase
MPSYAKFPITLTSGEGAYVWSKDGRRFIDFNTGYGVAILGHCHPTVLRALKEQSERLMVCHASLYNDTREGFLEALFKAVPAHLGRAFLCNSGAEAVEASLKLAMKRTRRRKFVAFRGAYHGKTIGALSVTWSAKYRGEYESVLPKVDFATYGDTSQLGQVVREETAAVIVEPVQGEGGVRVPPTNFLKEVEEVCQAKGSLMIIDEIQTGLGRTGVMWAHTRSKVKPDIMCLGKGLASGIPIGCVTATDEIGSTWDRGEHTTTFGGNPISCAAGRATLDEIISTQLWNNAEKQGARLWAVMNEFPKNVVREVRGVGLMLAVETRLPSAPIMKGLLSKGLLAILTGMNIIRFLPPINVSASVVGEAAVMLKSEFSAEGDH